MQIYALTIEGQVYNMRSLYLSSVPTNITLVLQFDLTN